MEYKTIRHPSLVGNLAAALTITVAAVSMLVTVVIAVVSFSVSEKNIRADADEAVNSLSGILAEPLWNLDEETVLVIGAVFFQNKNVAGLEITGNNNRVYYKGGRRVRPDDVKKTRDIFHGSEKIGTVTLSLERSYYNEKSIFLLRNILLIDLFVILSVYFVLRALIDLLIKKPVEDFSAAVSAYSGNSHAGDFMNPAFAEFEKLSAVLENMASKIDSQFRELNASEEKFRAAFDTSPDAIMLTGAADSRFFEVNESFTKMCGYNKDEVIGRTTDEIELWYDRASRDLFRKELAANGHVSNAEASFRIKGGTLFTALMSAVFVDISSRKYVLTIIRDISEMKKFEKEIAESEQKFRLAFDTSPDSININRVSDGMYLDINESFTRMTGYTRADVEGKTSAEIKIWNNPEDRAKLVAGLREKGYVDNLEAVFRKKNGTTLIGLMSSRTTIIKGEAFHINITRDITERKLSEEALRLRESYLNAIIENQPGLFWLKDRDGRFLAVNTNFARSCGLEDAGKVSGKTDMDIWPAELAKGYIADDIRVRDTAGASIVEEQIMDKGVKKWFETFKAPIIDDRGTVIGTTGYSRDITDRKQVENALKESEEKFRTIYMTTPDAIAISELATGKFRDINNGFTALLGYPASEIVGKSSVDLDMWSYRGEREKMISLFIEKGVVENYQMGMKTKNGDIKQGLMTVKPIEIGKEKLLFMMARDISAIKIAEQNLKESEEKFRTISEQSTVGILIVQGHRVRYANAGFSVISGYSVEEMLSWEEDRYQVFVSTDSREKVVEISRKNISEGGTGAGSFQLKMITKDKKEKWVGVYSKAISYSGKPAVMLSVADLTELKAAQEKILGTIEELERSNSELEKFAYATSHDLQEPLRMVSNFVQLLKVKYRGKIDADADFYIDTAVKGAVHMSELIKGLLDLSRIGRVERTVEDVDISGVVKDVIDTLEVKIRESEAKILAAGLPVIRADRVQMMQLFQNLISNGLKFSEKANNPRIEITFSKTLDFWTFCVKDNGIGISPKYFDKIFVVFQKLHAKDEYEGSGIGLAICKKIVEHHKGRIWVESEEGKGAAFYFTIPR